MIQLLRVDHRLLHGQVAVSWVQGLGSNCIFCVGDKVANDPVWKTTLKMGKPAGCKLVIKDILCHIILYSISTIIWIRSFLSVCCCNWKSL